MFLALQPTAGRVWKLPITKKRFCSHETNCWIRAGSCAVWNCRHSLLRAVETDGGHETTRRYTTSERQRLGSRTAELSVFDFDRASFCGLRRVPEGRLHPANRLGRQQLLSRRG